MLLPAPGADTSTTPIWERAEFSDAVLGASLSGDVKAPSNGPSCSMAQLVNSLMLTTSLLEEIQKASAAPVVRAAASKSAMAFKRCVELCQHLPLVTNNEGFYSLLAPFVARIKALEPGAQVVVPAGWHTGLIMLVLHCEGPDDFTLAVVSAADGLNHHPRKADPAGGGTLYNSPLMLRQLPAARVQDSAVWVVVFKACFFPDERHTAALLYEQLLPFFNRRPALANLSVDEGAAGDDDPARTDPATAPQWLAPRHGGDPHGFELATRAAATAMHLAGVSAQQMFADSFGGGDTGGGNPSPLPFASYMLLVRQQLAIACVPPLRINVEQGVPTPPSITELLKRAVRRLSATSAELTRGAEALPLAEMKRLQASVTAMAQLGAHIHKSRSSPVASF